MELIRAIVAVAPDGMIGWDGTIPWKKKEDLKRFKATTMGGTLIMGRRTWDSIGHRKLPGRETIVVSKTPQDGVLTCGTFLEALSEARKSDAQIWIAGGSLLYESAMPFIDEFDITVVTDFHVPDRPPDSSYINTVYFKPFITGMVNFTLHSEVQNAEDKTLLHRLYKRV